MDQVKISHSNKIDEKGEDGRSYQLNFVLGHSGSAQATGIEGIYVAILLFSYSNRLQVPDKSVS